MPKTRTHEKLDSLIDKRGHRHSLAIDNEYHSSSSEEDNSRIELSDTVPSDSQLLDESVLSETSSVKENGELRSRKTKKRTATADSTVTLDGVIGDVSKREKIMLKRQRQLDKKHKSDPTKFLSRFNDISFKEKSASIFESDEFYNTDYFGFTSYFGCVPLLLS